ncbi:MAG: SDR family NAD(P)-dependent oxidoreductase, partial [Streptosporangiaceae bacterium]
MYDAPGDSPDGHAIAIVGVACRFPDADDPPALLDLALTGRRAFRRLPPCRLELTDYYSEDPATPDTTYSTRAALVEGWHFDHAAFQVSPAAFASADPAHWLALETVSRALASAGFPGGKGLARNRVGVVIGNTLTGDVSRAAAMRLRWPYVRRVLADSMAAAGIPDDTGTRVLMDAAARYLAPFPAVTAGTLAGSIPASIAARICGHFGFRGGGHAVDSAASSSLLAVTSACTALTAGEIDVALAGGVDLSLDPFELVGLAKAGLLAAGEMRVYDESPTGFLPGEGCGVVVLMRAADAYATGQRVLAQIAGWGISSAGRPGLAAPDPGSQLLALRRAYRQAGIDPADVQMIEGHGTGTADGDLAELTALAELRKGARRPAALGSIKANIGHAKAAAGAAGLIKTVAAMTGEVMPPATGVAVPHPLAAGRDAAVRLPGEPVPWPAGPRIAAVSAMDPGGTNVHVVLTSDPIRQNRHDRVLGVLPRPRSWRAATGLARGPYGPARRLRSADMAWPLPRAATRTLAYLLHAPDRASLVAPLARIADIAPWLSDAELHDLACQLADEAADQGPVRVAIVASRPEQLARLADEAITLLPDLTDELTAARPGIFAADGAASRVGLLISGDVISGGLASRDPAAGAAGAVPGDLLARDAEGQLAALDRLGQLGVRPAMAVGRGLGEIAGLAWAHCLPEADASQFARRCGEILASPADSTAAQYDRSERLHALLAEFAFTAPRRHLISAATGHAVTSADDILDVLRAQLGAQDLLDEALSASSASADLLIETGPGHALAVAAARCCPIPAISLGGGPGDGHAAPLAVAALFAAGALGHPPALYAGEPARPFDIWREQIFIASPCQEPTTPAGTPAVPGPRTPAVPGPRTPTASAGPRPGSHSAEPGRTDPGRGHPQQPGRHGRAPRSHDTAPGGHDSLTADGDPPDGIAPWTRCYVEQMRPPRRPLAPGDGQHWRVRAAANHPFRTLVDELFPDEPGAGGTLAIVGSPDDPNACAAALSAAADAISSGQLVVISNGPGFSGFWASLHAEHPALGITLLRVPDSADGLRAARRYCATVPGQFRELSIDAAGQPREPVMVPAEVPGGDAFPLGPADVVLVSRGTRGAGLVLAQVLACCGAQIAIIGRPGPGEDTEGIDRLRSSGARVSYEIADLASRAAMAAALRRIERRLGPVTAIGHAAGTGRLRLVRELTETEFRAHVRAETASLRDMVSRVTTGRLRLITTFGSVVGRYGMAGGSLLAISSGSLAAQAQRLCDAIPGCRALHVEWPGWPGTGPGAGPDAGPGAGPGEQPELSAGLARAGILPISVEEGSRLLLTLLTT